MSRQPYLAASACPWPFRALLALLFVMGAQIGVADAAVRYVAPNGSDSNTGASASSPWATIAKANSSLQPGDRCYVAAGSYSNSINPANSGTASSRILFIGNPGNPGAVIVPSIALSKPYVSVKGFRADNGLDLSARFDSVAFCILGDIVFKAAKDCMVAHNSMSGRVRFLANNGLSCYDKLDLEPTCNANTERDTLRANTIALGTIRSGQKGFEMRAWTQHCLIDSNRISGTFDKTGTSVVDETWAFIAFHTYYNTFRDNRWTLEAVTSPPCSDCNWDAFRQRDSTHSNTWERDTMLVGLNSSFPIRFMFSASGDYNGYNKNHQFKSCVFKTKGEFWCQDTFDQITIENSVFMSSNGRALHIPFFHNSILRHNTFYAPAQTIWIENFSGSQSQISSNIFYSVNATQNSNTAGVLFYGPTNPDGFIADNNLYFTPTSKSQAGDLSIMWCCWPSSKPGSGTAWASMTGQDTHSKHGSPRFIDSTFAGFNPRLGAGSIARGVGAAGTDAGVIFGTSGSDVTPPSVIVSIGITQIFDRSLILNWTAPGDDGSVGTAAAYELRWSNQNITAANFAAAALVPVQPVPLLAGLPQVYSVTGLAPGTDYYYAIRARDESGNWSAPSPAAHAKTLGTDIQPPAPVQDLSSGQ